MTQPVIADAGPLIGLARAGLLHLVRQVYRRVVVPPAVLAELKKDEDRPGARVLRQAMDAGWMRREGVRRSRELTLLEIRLDRGEAEAILLAMQRPHRFLLMDERRGRSVARSKGVRVVGTGGVLIAAKKRGFIDTVTPSLERLVSAGYRLAPALREEIRHLAGE